MAKASNATIYTIAVNDPEDKDQNPKLLEDLGKVTGGEAYRPKSVDDLPDGRSVYSNVVARGQEVSFPVDTPIEIRFGSRVAAEK
jgi:hypothetical protein